MRRALHPGMVTVVSAALIACGPPAGATPVAYEAIDAAAYQAALDAGAASARATISASGTVDLVTSGAQTCAKYRGSRKACKRSTDSVIRYTLADGSVQPVRVPAGSLYLSNPNARPTSCQVLVTS